MARDIDIVVESLGSNSFLPLSTSGINTSVYDNAVKLRKLSRKLRNICCGASGDLAPDLAQLLDEIDKETGGKMDRIGALCLYGFSNGSALILALAKALQDRGAPRATYVAVADLTMIPFGRQPHVPGIGNLQPKNRPEVGLLLGASTYNVGLLSGALPPSAENMPPPCIANPGVVAAQLENYYTKLGNRVRVFAQSPAGAGTWWWTSTMHHGEVHGAIPGWNNIPVATFSEGTVVLRGPGSVDDGHHTDLCSQALKTMRHKAGLALGSFVSSIPAN